MKQLWCLLSRNYAFHDDESVFVAYFWACTQSLLSFRLFQTLDFFKDLAFVSVSKSVAVEVVTPFAVKASGMTFISIS